MSRTPDKLMVALQEGIPLVERPFARLAERLGLTEADVLADLATRAESGQLRRFGGIFHSPAMGFQTTLCALEGQARPSEAALAALSADTGVTHCYERGTVPAFRDIYDAEAEGAPRLWFTYGAPADGFDEALSRLTAQLGPARVLVLPAVRRFQTHVIIGRTARRRHDPHADPAGDGQPLTPQQQRLTAKLQGHRPPSATFFSDLARELETSPAVILAALSEMVASGKLKRIGAVLRHRQAGYAANAMCAWCLPDARIEAAAQVLVAEPAVTHCYQRPTTPAFPYGLYAMLHATTWTALRSRYHTLVDRADPGPGAVLCSLREHKKTSPVYLPAATTQQLRN